MKTQKAELDMEQPVIEAIQQGDHDAMEELIHRHQRWVRGVIFSVLGQVDEVDDVTQKVWIQVWREAHRLQDPAKWRPWLYRIARNAATDAGRSKQRQRRMVSNLIERQPDKSHNETSPAHRIETTEQHSKMLEAINSLPKLYREPFVLKHLQEWSYRQIGETMGLPVDTVETRLVRARRLLRKRLAGKL